MASGFSYQSARWQRLRLVHLSQYPLCAHCLQLGLNVTAAHVDHIITVRADPSLAFAQSNLQSLCVSCHSVKTQTTDVGAPTRGTTETGHPTDPSHHWNKD